MGAEFAGHRVFVPQYTKGKQGLPISAGTILEHARKLDIEIPPECGGPGVCGLCVVQHSLGLRGGLVRHQVRNRPFGQQVGGTAPTGGNKRADCVAPRQTLG